MHDSHHDRDRDRVSNERAGQDNSVLFSLANLARRAPAATPSAAAAPASPAAAAPGAPRAASLAGSTPDTALLIVPVLTPANVAPPRFVPEPRAVRHYTLAVAAVAAAAILTGGAVTAAAILRPATRASATRASATHAARALQPAQPAQPATTEVPRVEPAPTAPAIALLAQPSRAPVGAVVATAPETRPTHPSRLDAHTAHAPPSTTTSVQHEPSTTSASLPEACRRQCGGDAMCIMACTVHGPGDAHGPATVSAHGPPPATHQTVAPAAAALPTRVDVFTAMSSARANVVRCAGTRAGTITVHAVFASSGRPTQVTVSGPLAGTPEGSCAARAVQHGVHLPPFGAPSFAVDFPYTVGH
jgi:hypothetical protein